MKHSDTIFKTLAGACLSAALCAGSAMAQTTAPADPALDAAVKAATATAPPRESTQPALDSTAKAPSATSVSDDKLNQFADAYVAVQKVQKESTDKAANTTDPAAAQAAAAELQTKMKAAVEKNGMQVEEFNQIAQLMLTDLDLRAKVAEKVQARIGKT